MYVAELWRYPVKGLRGERLDRVMTTPDLPFPFDRRFALAHGNSRITYEFPRWALKTDFHMLMHEPDAILAELTPHFDETMELLTILRHGNVEVQASVNDPDGQFAINRYFQRILGVTTPTGTPEFVQARNFSFGNIEEPVISLINLASVRELSSTIGRDIDAARFRGNILIDDLSPWEGNTPQN